MTVRDLGDDDYDVIVVGGGPAGLSAGVRCANEGVKTLLVERDPILTGKKSWIAAVTKRREEELKSIGINLKELTENTIKSLRISADLPDDRNIGVLGTVPPKIGIAGYCISQSKFNRLMLDKADKLVIKDRTAVIDAKRKNGKVEIKTSDDKVFTSNILIDASGSLREPSRMLGREFNARGLWTDWGYTIEGITPEDAGIPDSHTFMFHFNPSIHGSEIFCYNPYPMGENIVDFGINTYTLLGKRTFWPSKEPPIGWNVKDHCLKQLTPWMELYKKKFPNAFKGKIVREFYGVITDGWETKPYDNNLLMIGDAAGQSNEWLCEGFVTSSIFGNVAGDMAVESINKGDYSKNFLKRYYSRLVEKDIFTNRGLLSYAANLMTQHYGMFEPVIETFISGLESQNKELFSEVGFKIFAGGATPTYTKKESITLSEYFKCGSLAMKPFLKAILKQVIK